MSFLVNVQRYWAVILFCGSIIAQWVRIEMKVNDAHERIDANEEKIDKLDTKVQNMEKTSDTFAITVQVALATINTNIQYIKEGINELKNK